MAIHLFETITAGQALLLALGDMVIFSTASASLASVSFGPGSALLPGLITITAGGRSVVFTVAVSAVSQAGGLRFDDGSRLYVGDPFANVISGSGRNDAFFGGDGADLLRATGGHVVMQGNQGDDQLFGSTGSDILYGGQGDDLIVTGGGANVGQGNVGLDTLMGGPGADTLLGGRDSDTVSGGGGADVLVGNLGDDSVQGGSDAETILGEDGADTLSGGASGDDRLDGGAGDDVITAASGQALGGAGHDRISGSAARMNGGDGNDTISPAGARSLIEGGAGADLFSFASGASGQALDQADMILDWLADDRLRFVGLAVTTATYAEQTAATQATAQTVANTLIGAGTHDVVAVQVGADVLVFADSARNNGTAEDVVVLVGRTLADISAANFAN